jgi:hypothetical protein
MGGGTCGKESRVNRIRKWLASFRRGTPYKPTPEPSPLPIDDDATMCEIVRILESNDPNVFEELARRLQN